VRRLSHRDTYFSFSPRSHRRECREIHPSTGDFVHVLGDAHVYNNHVEPLREQLERRPRPFPKLIVDSSVKNIDDFRLEHLSIVDYDPHGKIHMEMSV
jgi:thymidylate synthase